MPLNELEIELARAEKNAENWSKRAEALRRQRDAYLKAENAGKPRGRNGGRKPALTPEQITLAQSLIYTHSLETIAERFNVSTRTLERYKIRPIYSACNL